MMTNTAAAVPASPLPALSDSSDGVTFTMLGATIRLIARATDTDGRFTMFEQTTPSGWGPPRHVHANEDEIVYVLETEGWVCCFGDRVVTMGKNDVAERIEVGPRAYTCSDTRESIDKRLAEAYYVSQPFAEFLSLSVAE